MDMQAFKGFSKDLDSLDKSVKNKISELIFSYREGVFSVTIVLNSIGDFENLIGFKLNNKLKAIKSNRFGVDLESLKTDKVRIYLDVPGNDLISLYGYYMDRSGNILEKKIYKRNGSARLLIDRYDSENNLISKDEPESVSTEMSWKGPNDIIKIAKGLNYRCIFMKKELKDQCYLRLLVNND
jgi:hypothetical protein